MKALVVAVRVQGSAAVRNARKQATRSAVDPLASERASHPRVGTGVPETRLWEITHPLITTLASEQLTPMIRTAFTTRYVLPYLAAFSTSPRVARQQSVPSPRMSPGLALSSQPSEGRETDRQTG